MAFAAWLLSCGSFRSSRSRIRLLSCRYRMRCRPNLLPDSLPQLCKGIFFAWFHSVLNILSIMLIMVMMSILVISAEGR